MFKNIKLVVLLAAALGAGVGAVATMQAQSWPNQCYSSTGSGCPVCGSSCLGGNYLCCNNSASKTE
jgi:hypothetical protein